MNPEDVIKFEKMMANARDTWGANYQALLRVARAAKEYEDAWNQRAVDEDEKIGNLWGALKEVEHLLK